MLIIVMIGTRFIVCIIVFTSFSVNRVIIAIVCLVVIRVRVVMIAIVVIRVITGMTFVCLLLV